MVSVNMQAVRFIHDFYNQRSYNMPILTKIGMTALATVFVLLQIQLWMGKGSVTEIYNLHMEIEKQKQENSLLDVRNYHLSLEIADLKKGTEGIEEIARSKLGMIKKGETFYMIIDPGK